MKPNYLLLILMFGMCPVACAQTPPMLTQEVTVPNFDRRSPACVVKVPALNPPCTPGGCTLPAPVGSTLGSIKLDFSCLPNSAPTGFENPAPEVKVQTLRVKNARVHLSLSDGVFEPTNEQSRYLTFCLYGKSNNFCGIARVMSLDHRTKVDGTPTVKAFLQGIEFQGALPIDGR